MSEGKTEYQLKSPPEDGISAVEFCPHSPSLLLVSSWDKTVRLYDVAANTQRAAVSNSLPVLDCAWQDQSRVLSGGLDKAVKMMKKVAHSWAHYNMKGTDRCSQWQQAGRQQAGGRRPAVADKSRRHEHAK